jgi:phage major head subunit gpT-like protein
MSLDTARSITNNRALTKVFLNNNFDRGLERAAPFYPEIATVVPSVGADEEYGGLGSVPGMREWLGDRQFNTLRGAKFSIENKHWESGVEVLKTDIEDARLVKYGSILEELGMEAMHHPDELMFELLVAGESQACFDGQSFFDTDHAWGDSGTQSNDISSAAASGTSPTAAEYRTAYHAARAAMLGFKRDNGKLFHRPTIKPITDLLMLVPSTHEEAARKAFEQPYLASGESNFVMDTPRILATSYLTADKFYLLRIGQPLKPFVFQARQPLRRQTKGWDDQETKYVKFMVDARYNAGYLAWWNAVLTTWT